MYFSVEGAISKIHLICQSTKPKIGNARMFSFFFSLQNLNDQVNNRLCYTTVLTYDVQTAPFVGLSQASLLIMH